MNINKYISIVLLASGLSVYVSSHADTKSDYMNIQNHWKMIMDEKDKSKQGTMIKEHRMMLDNFDKAFSKDNRQNGMQGNHKGEMSGHHMDGMSGEHMNMMNSMNMQRLEMNMMGY